MNLKKVALALGLVSALTVGSYKIVQNRFNSRIQNIARLTEEEGKLVRTSGPSDTRRYEFAFELGPETTALLSFQDAIPYGKIDEKDSLMTIIEQSQEPVFGVMDQGLNGLSTEDVVSLSDGNSFRIINYGSLDSKTRKACRKTYGMLIRDIDDEILPYIIRKAASESLAELNQKKTKNNKNL